MKNAEQLIKDFRENEELRKKFQETLNKLRDDETISVQEAGIKVAHELDYEVSEDEAKKFIACIQNRKNSGKTKLSDEELVSAAGGTCYCTCDCSCGSCVSCW